MSLKEELEELNKLINGLDLENIRLSVMLDTYKKKLLLCHEIMAIDDNKLFEMVLVRILNICGKRLVHGENFQEMHIEDKTEQEKRQ